MSALLHTPLLQVAAVTATITATAMAVVTTVNFLWALFGELLDR